MPVKRVFILSLFVFFALIYSIVMGFLLPFSGFLGFQYLMVPCVIIVLITIWMLPEVEFAKSHYIRILIPLFIVLMCIWPPYLSIIPLPGKIWAPPSRILLFLLIILGLIQFSVCRSTKRQLLDYYQNHKTTLISVILLSLIQVISVPFSHQFGASISFLFKYSISTIFIFIIIISTTNYSKSLKSISVISCIILLYLSMISFYEASVEQNIWAQNLPDWMIGGGEAMVRVLTPIYRAGEYRVLGVSVTSLEFAELFVIIFPFALYVLMEHSKIILRIAAAFIIIISFFAAINTGARLAHIGVIFGMSLYFLLWAVRVWIKDKKGILGPAITIMYLTVGFASSAAVMMSTGLSNMLFLGSAGTEASTQARYEQWSDGIPIILSNPITGHGIGAGASKLGFANPAGVLTIDSYWLSVLIETGIVGFVCFFVFFGSLISKLIKIYILDDDRNINSRLGAAFATSLSSFLLIKLILSQINNHSLVYCIAALALVCCHSNEVKSFPLLKCKSKK